MIAAGRAVIRADSPDRPTISYRQQRGFIYLPACLSEIDRVLSLSEDEALAPGPARPLSSLLAALIGLVRACAMELQSPLARKELYALRLA